MQKTPFSFFLILLERYLSIGKTPQTVAESLPSGKRGKVSFAASLLSAARCSRTGSFFAFLAATHLNFKTCEIVYRP